LKLILLGEDDELIYGNKSYKEELLEQVKNIGEVKDFVEFFNYYQFDENELELFFTCIQVQFN